MRSVCGHGAGPSRPIVPVGWPVYGVWADPWELRSDSHQGLPGGHHLVTERGRGAVPARARSRLIWAPRPCPDGRRWLAQIWTIGAVGLAVPWFLASWWYPV